LKNRNVTSLPSHNGHLFPTASSLCPQWGNDLASMDVNLTGLGKVGVTFGCAFIYDNFRNKLYWHLVFDFKGKNILNLALTLSWSGKCQGILFFKVLQMYFIACSW